MTDTAGGHHWWHWLLVVIPGGLIGLAAWRSWRAHTGGP